MKIRELLTTILKNAPVRGTFELPDLLRFATKNTATGMAVAKEAEIEFYLAFIGGEPEGAVYIDEKGTLFGDKAIMMITDRESFVFYDLSPDIVDSVIMGSRIFEKSHLRKGVPSLIPEVGKKAAGIGNLTVVVQHGGEAQNGVRVSIRKDGKIVGSDVTTADGSVGFRVLHGAYDCIVQDRNQQITTRPITFDPAAPRIIVDV
ncbi:MAG TPA: hypothetical protein VLY83_01780 [Methanoregula sp.]|nr:hypothetical protein [Methanoregula sp.]